MFIFMFMSLNNTTSGREEQNLLRGDMQYSTLVKQGVYCLLEVRKLGEKHASPVLPSLDAKQFREKYRIITTTKTRPLVNRVVIK